MKFKKVLGLALAATAAVSLASCGNDPTTGTHTYNTYTTVSPSNWNELTYQDNNDTQIMSRISSSFFSYDYVFDKDGKPVSGQFQTKYDAATALKDVTAKYAGDENYAVPATAEKNYAYEITLRNDLKWDDGTAIKAEDFVYSMKEQLNPLFLNYRADSFYASGQVIHNAEAYVKQGSTDKLSPNGVIVNDGLEGLDDFLAKHGNDKGYVNWTYSFGEIYKDGAWSDANVPNEVVDSGVTVSRLHELFVEKVTSWGYDEAKANEFFLDEASIEYTFPKLDFDKVGLFVGDNEYKLVMVLDKPLELLKEDGSLSYQAAYNMSSLPLVHKTKFEANKKAPAEGSTLWTSTYNSSVDSTASWGPYKLTQFQEGKMYVLERNTNWYGYNLPENKGYYQTDKIVCETIAEYETALLKFKKGEIDSIGIQVSVADTYKNSEQAVYTPDDYVGSMQLQSSKDALKGREEAGINKTILSYVDFRKAISLGFDRAEYNKTCSTSSKPGFGLFNSMHYYDVENGGVYRNTDVAKQVLCDVYAVDATKFKTLDDAVDSITGYNLEEARKLVDKAYDEALAAGDIKATDKVRLTVGSGADTEQSRRVYNFIDASLKKLVEGTKLAGRLETEFKDFQTKWATDFRAGAYDICTGGWSGAAWDPGYFLLAYLSPSYMYSRAWDTSAVKMTFTMPKGGEDGKDVTETMSLIDWYNCLNGIGGAKYDWSIGAIEDSSRLALIAALEKEILSVYYTVPLQNYYSAELITYKWDYASREYNTFMAYGGLKYMKYNYNDEQWTKFVQDNGGEIDYSK